LYLIIKNTGKSLARNVKLEFRPPLQNSEPAPQKPIPKLAESPLIQHGLETMPPGFEIRLILDNALPYMNKSIAAGGVPPMVYYVDVTYRGGLRDDLHSVKFVLDL